MACPPLPRSCGKARSAGRRAGFYLAFFNPNSYVGGRFRSLRMGVPQGGWRIMLNLRPGLKPGANSASLDQRDARRFEQSPPEASTVASRLILYDNHPLPPPYQGGEPAHQFPSSFRRGPGGGERAWPVNAYVGHQGAHYCPRLN